MSEEEIRKEQFLKYFHSPEGRADFEEAAELVRNNDTDGLVEFLIGRRYQNWLKQQNEC